jgi:uncharacterized repeat protein (TIGR01451 family)
MTSGFLAHRGVPVPKVDTGRRSSRARRLAYVGTCTGAVAALVLGPAVAALANSANPTEASAKVWNCGDSGAPTTNCSTGNAVVEVSGTWSWAELADQKSSPQQNCAGRYGVGWSVDWWGMSNSKTATAISGLHGSTVTPATKSTPPATGGWSALSPGGVWQVKSDKTYFHTGALYNGFLADLCNNASPSKNNTGPEGSFRALAVYPSRDAIPPALCVNFYDPHGKQNQWSSSASDNYASKDGDNSIQTNDFNPSRVSGNCFVPQNASPTPPKSSGSPKVVVTKSGPAFGTAGGTGTYTITLTNNGDATANGPTSFVDELPIGESFQSVDASGSDNGMSCHADSSNAQQVDCSYSGDIAAGASRSVAVVIGYAPDTGGKNLKDCAGLMPAGATACVTTFIPKPGKLDLAIVKTASAQGVKTNDTLTYTLQVTNVSDQPTTGPVTVTDAVPNGLSIVGTPTGSGWTCAAAAAVVTCTLDQPPLAAGQAAAPITVTTTVLPSAVSVLVNTGVVQTPGDVNPANNRSTVRTPVTQVLGTKIVKSPATPARVAPARATRVPSVLPFTGWNTSTAITIALALLVGGLRLINMAAKRKRA